MCLGPEHAALTLSAHLDKWMDTGNFFSLSLKVLFVFFYVFLNFSWNVA